jgi:hypothetical protein
MALAASSAFEGRWRLDPAQSSALDGWTAWDLVISTVGSQVTLQHEMQWRSSKVVATNAVDTTHPGKLKDFFRVTARHMGVYPEKGGETAVEAHWLDAGRTLRLEAQTPVEISQGTTVLRIYSEYRLLEGDDALLLIELHSSRPRPLVYRFVRVAPAR